MEDYNEISNEYERTNEKPDKKYSILPTILKILRPLNNQFVIDVGCGDGFFTEPISKEAKLVYGIDKSKVQIEKAKKLHSINTKYLVVDMFDYNYPKSDKICIPFILNQIETKKKISFLLEKFYKSLSKDGLLVGTLDTPKKLIHDSKKYGVIKKVKSLLSESPLEIELYDRRNYLLTLHVRYYPRKIIEEIFRDVGFVIKWIKPIVSKEGITKKGKDYWRGYLKNCDLSYFIARRV